MGLVRTSISTLMESPPFASFTNTHAYLSITGCSFRVLARCVTTRPPLDRETHSLLSYPNSVRVPPTEPSLKIRA